MSRIGVMRHIYRSAASDPRSDRQLLDLFRLHRDEDAFAALVKRHGPMVHGVGRRILGQAPDADDAFQAVFVVLARKAHEIKQPDQLGHWLYGVACRTTREARSRLLRRRAREHSMNEPLRAETEPDIDRRELVAMLDQAIERLPERYRVPVILCELEGRSRQEVARILGIPEGTLSSRLAEARKRLAARLAGPCAVASIATLTTLLSPDGALATVPMPLLDATVQAALAESALTESVAVLSHGVLKAMLMKKLKLTMLVLASMGLGTAGVGWSLIPTRPVAAAPDDTPKGKPGDPKKSIGLAGGWKVEAMIEGGKERPLPPTGTPYIFFVKESIMMTTDEKVEAVFKFTVNDKASPRHLSLDGNGRTMNGIYMIEGDKLTICLGKPNSDQRPTSFEAGDDVAVLKLVRAPNAKIPDGKTTTEMVGAAAKRNISANNLKQILLAMHNYHDVHRAFPSAAICDKSGKPLLSWRVAILPYIEQEALYKQFKLDEPWDSEHNKPLLAQMPKIYGTTGTKTHFQAFVGGGAAFDLTKGMKIADFKDGTSNTALIVEAVDTVEWSKPDDITYDPSAKLPKLGGTPHANGFHVGLCDGSVRFVSEKVAEKTIRAFITRAGGEVIDNK